MNKFYDEFMVNKKAFFISILLLTAFQSLYALPLAEQFKQLGYLEICDQNDRKTSFNSLYATFDELIEFLQTNPAWAQKLYSAKERFIRSQERNYYSTDFFGFYDESQREGRSQISFYYASHLHEFIYKHYPEFKTIIPLVQFFDVCKQIQKAYDHIFNEAASELGIESIFSCTHGKPPILLKVIKYLPSYVPSRPHYDGTAFSLFLDSTDTQSLLLSAYKSAFKVEDFEAAIRLHHNSILLIPGSLLTEFSIYPTPHIVTHSGKTRYATIAFAMRPHYTPAKNEFSPLPNFKH